MKVKLDTGTHENVIPLALYKALEKDPKKLKPTNTNLTAYGVIRFKFSVVVISNPNIETVFTYWNFVWSMHVCLKLKSMP